jgi:hypothetical protein
MWRCPRRGGVSGDESERRETSAVGERGSSNEASDTKEILKVAEGREGMTDVGDGVVTGAALSDSRTNELNPWREGEISYGRASYRRKSERTLTNTHSHDSGRSVDVLRLRP